MKYLFSLFIVLMLAGCDQIQSDPKPGEIWHYENASKERDPFSKDYGNLVLTTQDDSVISVKDGWVEYVIVAPYRNEMAFTSEIQQFKISEHPINKK